jgi:hypothetical protein
VSPPEEHIKHACRPAGFYLATYRAGTTAAKKGQELEHIVICPSYEDTLDDHLIANSPYDLGHFYKH